MSPSLVRTAQGELDRALQLAEQMLQCSPSALRLTIENARLALSEGEAAAVAAVPAMSAAAQATADFKRGSHRSLNVAHPTSLVLDPKGVGLRQSGRRQTVSPSWIMAIRVPVAGIDCFLSLLPIDLSESMELQLPMRRTVVAMMDLKPGCECCDVDLPPESLDARICTFECTYCATCAEEMNGICKNCGGNLVQRPVRPAGFLVDNPASTVRVFNPHNCPVHNPALATEGV